MRTVVIESLGAYERSLEHFGDELINWKSSSPGLISLLQRRNVNIQSLEEGLAVSKQNAIGRAAHEFALQASHYLDKELDLRDVSAEFIEIFGESLPVMTHVLMYKALLLDELMNRQGQVVCVGDPDAYQSSEFKLNFDRFDTVFAMIAGQTDSNHLSVLQFKEADGKIEGLVDSISSHSMTAWEKALSILTNTWSSFLFKIWRNFEQRGFLKVVQLWIRPRRNVFVLKDCELIEESFMSLLKSGAAIRRLRIPKLLSETSSSLEPFEKPYKIKLAFNLRSRYVEALENQELILNSASYAACEIAVTRLLAAAATIKKIQARLDSELSYVRSQLGSDSVIVTNYFASVSDRLFGVWCRKNKIPVFTFEHGITMGLSDRPKYSMRYYGMFLGLIGVYHWSTSLSDAQFIPDYHTTTIGGIPKVIRKTPLHFIQRKLARSWLGFKKSDKVIVYVADLEKNNFMYGPYVENDLQYVVNTKSIVVELLRRHPDSFILLKLYPTHRYMQSYDFGELAELSNRLRIIKSMDFRFIRAAVDLIALSSSLSTLGWALGAKCPVWFFEKDINPIRLSGKQLKLEVAGIRRVIELRSDLLDSGKSQANSTVDKIMTEKF